MVSGSRDYARPFSLDADIARLVRGTTERGGALRRASPDSVGSRAQTLFNENRIEVVIGVLSNATEQAVLDHIKGELATGDNICDH